MVHYGSQQPDVPALMIHCASSSGVSERASEQTNEHSGACKLGKQCGAVRTNGQMDERVAQCLCLCSWLFWTIVWWGKKEEESTTIKNELGLWYRNLKDMAKIPKTH